MVKTTNYSLFSALEEARAENESLRLNHLRDQETIELYKQELDRARELLIQAKKEMYGPHKERWESPEQGKIVFNEAELESVKPEGEAGEDDASGNGEIKVAAHTKRRGHRRPLPKDLPREIVVVELPEGERVDANGVALKVVGKEISEKLTYEPAKAYVTEFHRLRYGYDSGEPVKTAPPVPSIIPKGIATPSLLSAIITAKYADGLPLYRQEEIFARQDIELARTSMARWVVQAAAAAMPIRNVLEEHLLAASYLQCDETHVQVLKEEGRRPETKSWMWMRTNPAELNRIVLFDYDPSRSGKVAEKLLSDFTGVLQCDGYAGYNGVAKKEGLTRIGCNMHGRRGFKKADEAGSKGSRKLAGVALKFYQDLYAVEREAKGMTWRERHRLREEKAKAIWNEFKAWAEETVKRVPPKSSIGEALGYFLREYDHLTGYLADGKLEIDNGDAERMIKGFAIGRKNWLFSDTPAGAEASSLFYSFVITAKANGVNPYEALKKIFVALPLSQTIEDYERLAGILLGTTPLV